jgi:hypothetical protein
VKGSKGWLIVKIIQYQGGEFPRFPKTMFYTTECHEGQKYCFEREAVGEPFILTKAVGMKWLQIHIGISSTDQLSHQFAGTGTQTESEHRMSGGYHQIL